MSITATPESAERIIAFLDALARGVETLEIAFSTKSGKMQVTRGPEIAEFTLKAKSKTEAYVPSEHERVTEEKRLARVAVAERAGRYVDWNLRQPTYPTDHQVLTGGHTLSIEGWMGGARKNWSDGKTQTREGLLDQIIVGFDAYTLAAKAQREEHEDWNRRYHEQQRRRALERQRQERETARAAFLAKIIDRVEEANRLRAWLFTTSLEAPNAPAFGRIHVWAGERLASLSRVAQPNAIELEAAALFPEVDDLADPVVMGEAPEPSSS